MVGQLAASVKASGIINIYGDWGVSSSVKAQGTLTLDTQPSDGDDFTVHGKVYTFQTTLTNVDGNINIGGSLAQAKLNLVAAFDLSGVAGTDYATLMTEHPTVDVAAFIVNDAILTAKMGGIGPNTDFDTTENFTIGTNTFDAATLGTTTAGTSVSTFEIGNNFYGNGTKERPYATQGNAGGYGALVEYLVAEQSFVFDQNYVLLMISKSGETNVYDDRHSMHLDSDLASIGGTLDGSINAKLVWQGWNKDDGEKTTYDSVSSWTDVHDGEKPQMKSTAVTYIQLMNGVSNGYRVPTMQFKDVIIDMAGYTPEGQSLFYHGNTIPLGHGVQTPYQYFGCIFRGGIQNVDKVGSTISTYSGLTACLWEGSTYRRDLGVSLNGNVMWQNSVFPNLVTGLDMNQTSKTVLTLASCILASAGGKCIEMILPNQAPLGNFNVFKRNAAVFGTHQSLTYLTLKDMIDTASGTPPIDQTNSFDVDPLFNDQPNNDYTLKAGSIAEASGGILPGRAAHFFAIDYEPKAWNKYDFLNNLWNDVVQEEFLIFGTLSNIRTRRSVGMFQTTAAGAPQNPAVLFPTTSTEGSPQHIVIQGNKSPQDGTLQAQVIIANDADLSDVLVIKDSVPINVTASNNKINFQEDGVAVELTATLTVGIYTTASLLTEIKTQLEVAGAGTYTVTYDGLLAGNTKKFTIAVSGARTTFELLWHSGTDIANSARGLLGFIQFDTLDIASHVSEVVRENHYDATVEWKYANDYTAGLNPGSGGSGTWTNDLGTGDPSGSGIAGTDGAPGDGLNDIRCDIPSLFGFEGKYVGGSLYSGGKIGQL